MRRYIPVGKRIKGIIYFHRMYIHSMIFEYKLLSAEDFQMAGRKAKIEYNEYHVIKWDKGKRRISFILCNEFNSKFEPTVEMTITVDLITGRVTRRDYRNSDNPPIYHHTWLMVEDDYPCINIHRGKIRSADIEDAIKALKIDKRLIGYKRYWEDICMPWIRDYLNHPERGVRVSTHFP